MFKNQFLLFLMLFPIWGAAQIKLNTKNYSGDVILARYVQGKPYVVDTLKGNGAYVYKEKLNKGIYVFLLGKKYFEFPVGADQSFSLSVDGSKELFPTLQINGSSDNIKFQEFLKLKEQEQNDRFIEQKLASIQDPFFSAYLKALNPYRSRLKNDTAAFYDSRKHYWDNMDFHIPEMLNSPILSGKMDYYFNRMFPQNPDTIIGAMTEFLNRPMADTIKNAALSFLLPYTFEHKTMGMEKSFVWLAENYFIGKNNNWLGEKIYESIKEQYYLNKFCLVGDKARALELTCADGTPFELSGQNGDYTLILFYDISCGSCKKMVQELSAKSTELFLKGVDIVAVNTETDEQGWQKYIVEQKIVDWVNVMDLHGDSNYHAVYGVHVTPMVYLLDRSKTIIGKKLTVDQVFELIKQTQKLSQS